MLILFLLLPLKTYAIYEITDSRCTDKMKITLREEATSIAYKTDKAINKDKILYNVNLYNIDESISLKDLKQNKIYTNNNSIINNIEPGTILNLSIIANEKSYCNGYKINTITIQIPYYNVYSTNELCKGYEDYILCKENMDINISLEEFEERMATYIESLKKEDEPNEKEEQTINSEYKLTIFDFIIKYNKYISGFGLIMLVIYITVVINNMNKKRGIL